MAFRTNAAPYQRAKKSTTQIMLILVAALAIVWLFGIIYSFKLTGQVNDFVAAFNEANQAKIEAGKVEALSNVSYGIRSILIVVIALVTTAACDVLTTLAKHKKGSKVSLGKEILHDLAYNYSYVTAIIFALTLPVYVSYYAVIIGSIFATVVVKNFFGGFGKNVFNPAIMARIFVGLCFTSQFDAPSILAASTCGVDAVTGATLTTAFKNSSNWLATSVTNGYQVIGGQIFTNFSMSDLLFGQYIGALGETCTIVILVLGVVLSVLKVINWRTPVFYLGTVAVTSLVIALVCGLNDPLSYVVYQLSLGGLMFGAVFMLTDPVTGPTSPFGKSLVAVFAGLMTVLIRLKGSYPEGVMYSIALCNLISPAVDYLTVGKSNAKLGVKYATVFGLAALSIALCAPIAYSVNGGKEVYDVNGIDAPLYDTLASTLTLNDGDQFAKVDNYEVKTSHVSAYVVDKEANISLDAVYDIVNSNGEKVATAYMVKGNAEIPVEGYPVDCISTVMVAINNDGTVYGFGNIKPINVQAWFTKNIEEYASTSFVGKDETNYASVDGFANATYSSNFIKTLIGYAYAEYNAGK